MDMSVSWSQGSLKTVPEVFAKVSSVQFLAPFWSRDLSLGSLVSYLNTSLTIISLENIELKLKSEEIWKIRPTSELTSLEMATGKINVSMKGEEGLVTYK